MDANAQSNLTTMQLTPAQVELLDFVSHRDASSIYEYLHTTLSIALVNENDIGATSKAVNAWYFALELMRCIHLIAAEKPSE